MLSCLLTLLTKLHWLMADLPPKTGKEIERRRRPHHLLLLRNKLGIASTCHFSSFTFAEKLLTRSRAGAGRIWIPPATTRHHGVGGRTFHSFRKYPVLPRRLFGTITSAWISSEMSAGILSLATTEGCTWLNLIRKRSSGYRFQCSSQK